MTPTDKSWYFDGLSHGMLTAACIAEREGAFDISVAIRAQHDRYFRPKLAEMKPGDLGIGIMQPGDLGVEI